MVGASAAGAARDAREQRSVAAIRGECRMATRVFTIRIGDIMPGRIHQGGRSGHQEMWMAQRVSSKEFVLGEFLVGRSLRLSRWAQKNLYLPQVVA